MKSSKNRDRDIYAAVFSAYKKEKIWYAFAFIVNPRMRSKEKQLAMEDFLWDLGFRDNLHLKV